VFKATIKDFCFSPEGTYLVVACQDGYLRFFDWEKDKLLLSAKSYYGGFLCVDWSRDGRYIIAGGEDDLVTVWEWTEMTNKCVCRARGEGHQSWVSAISFDNYYKGDPNIYRFGSVGEDGKLCIWEYNSTEYLTTEVRKKKEETPSGPKNLYQTSKQTECRGIRLTPTLLIPLLTTTLPPTTTITLRQTAQILLPPNPPMVVTKILYKIRPHQQM